MSRWLARTSSVFVLIGLASTSGGQGLGRVGSGPAARAEVEPTIPITLEGIVALPGGAPAEGAVVLSSAGGRASTDASGSYRLDVRVSASTSRVQITAVGGTGANLVASASVDVATGTALTRVAPLELATGSCQPSWLPTFGGEPGVNLNASCVAVFDDGGGPALYVGGLFYAAGGVDADHIAKWDGTHWAPVGNGLNDRVYTLAVYDDGNGEALYAGGQFTNASGLPANKIAKWDGASWSAVGGGLGGILPLALVMTVFDDGGGPALYVGGSFLSAGGKGTSKIAKWDGTTWSALGTGLNSDVHALAGFDDGNGPALYAGGLFTTAGGVPASYAAKWDGASWTPLGSGMNGPVDSMAAFDDGSGLALYTGGSFTTAGGVAANRIAKWDGASWNAVGILPGTPVTTYALSVADLGGGPALYAAAGFTVARWDGTSWIPLGSGMNLSVTGLVPFDDGSGRALYAVGLFWKAGGITANSVAKWDGSSWSALGTGVSDEVDALAVFDDGSGPALFAGGEFTSAGGVELTGIGKWDGAGWAALGSGITAGIPEVNALTVFDDGTGSALYVGGQFQGVGGVAANRIAKWDGANWSPLGSGFSGATTSPRVLALTSFDDGTGPALYAGGVFLTSGTTTVNYVARWDGANWLPLGSGLSGGVNALAVFDDGTGPALYAGGYFSTAGGVLANGIARWDGASWAPLGSGRTGDVYALVVFDDGSGPALIAGGSFTLSKWDGSSWTALPGAPGLTYALTVFDDGSGPALFVGGVFSLAGGTAANSIARWDGTNWSPLGSGLHLTVNALTSFNDRTGPALYAGGDFAIAYDSGDSYLAKWGCPDTNPPTITCPASMLVDDRRGNGRGEVLTFTVTALDEEDPTPSLVCSPPSGSLFPSGTTTVTCTATDFSGNQSTCQFTVTVRAMVREP